MSPSRILSAIHLGQTALDAKHAALGFLWRKFSACIRSERRRRKIKLKDFASGLGVTPTMAAYMEGGIRPWGTKRAELAVKLLTRREQWPD